MKLVVTSYLEHVKQLRVTSGLPPSATASGGAVGTLQADRAAEFTAHGFQQHVLDQSVLIRFTAPGMHRNNSFIESFWRSHLAMVCASLYTTGWGAEFWPFASNHSTWLANRTDRPVKSRVSPFERLMSGALPDLSAVRIFGSPAFAHVGDAPTLRLEPRGRPLHYVGHSSDSKCWLLLNVQQPVSRLTVSSGMVTFDESPLLQLTHSASSMAQRALLTTQFEYTSHLEGLFGDIQNLQNTGNTELYTRYFRVPKTVFSFCFLECRRTL